MGGVWTGREGVGKKRSYLAAVGEWCDEGVG